MKTIWKLQGYRKHAVITALVLAWMVAPISMAQAQTIGSTESYAQTAAECAPLLTQPAVRRAWQLAKAQLQAQGMQLVTHACPMVKVGDAELQQVVDVRVIVLDSEAASHFVRGPLADGEEVDLGPVSWRLQTAADGAAEDVSPDVVFNRQWLRNVLKAQGWQAVTGYWCMFVPLPSR